MPLSQDKLFLTPADVRLYREFSANISDSKVNLFIAEGQAMDIEPFVGNNLYQLMQTDWNITDFTTARFNDLWFGVDYQYQNKEYKFSGLGRACALFTYSRLVLNQQANISRFGVESLQSDISEDVSSAGVRGQASRARVQAQMILTDAKLYFQRSTEFPEFTNSSVKSGTAFSFFKL